MGWDNPPIPWSELERELSGRPGRTAHTPGDGGDSPAWSRKRRPYEPPPAARCAGRGPRALRRAALPLQLQLPRRRQPPRGAGRGGRPARAARRWPSPTTTASTAWSASPRRPGRVGLPHGVRRRALARPDRAAGRRCPTPRATTCSCWPATPRATAGSGRRDQRAPSWRAGEGRARSTTLDELAGAHGGHWLVLTGCRKGTVPAALRRRRPAAAGRALDGLVGRVRPATTWRSSCGTTATRSTRPQRRPGRLAGAAACRSSPPTTSHYATPARRRLATALAAVRARRSLDEIDGWLPAAGGAHLRSGAEQAARLRPLPRVVERAAELGRGCAFDLQLVAPQPAALPDAPAGHDEMTWLRAA